MTHLLEKGGDFKANLPAFDVLAVIYHACEAIHLSDAV
jgi:hypothetical protein